MKRLLTALLALALNACALHVNHPSAGNGLQTGVEWTPSADDLALQNDLETARQQATAAVQLLARDGDPDGFLARTEFCNGSTFICSMLSGLTGDQRAFLNLHFLNAQGYHDELHALGLAQFIVTSDPAAVTVNGLVKYARANMATNEIRFYRPWVASLTGAERVALLLHEIWHLNGLPDEGEDGPFSLTQDAINASAAAQTVAWIARTATPMPSDPTRLFYWQTHDFNQMVASGKTITNFELTLNLSSNGWQLDQASLARVTFRRDLQGRYFALEYSRAANASQGTLRLIYFNGTQSTVLQEAAVGTFTSPRLVVWNRTIAVEFLSFPLVDNAEDFAGTFQVETTNASAGVTYKTPY